jgi:hypothetical protein
MYEIGESRLTKKTLLEHISIHKRKYGGHISADKDLSGTAVNIMGLIEQERPQSVGDNWRGGGGWG